MAVLVWSCVPGVSGVPCVEQFNCGGVEKGDCDEVGVSTGGGGGDRGWRTLRCTNDWLARVILSGYDCGSSY